MSMNKNQRSQPYGEEAKDYNRQHTAQDLPYYLFAESSSSSLRANAGTFSERQKEYFARETERLGTSRARMPKY
jgi:hypothetical protein